MAEPSLNHDTYDVIICGTDLIQSILSSALSRAGKKVLHCDGNDWYGGFDAILYAGTTLNTFIERCQRSLHHRMIDTEETNSTCPNDDHLNFIELLPRDKYADLRLHSQSFIPPHESRETNLSSLHETQSHNINCDEEQGTQAESDKYLLDHCCLDTSDMAKSTNTQKSKAEGFAVENMNPFIFEHGFSLDITPYLLFASGDSVQGLIRSGVADYLEFKSLRGLHIIMEDDQAKLKNKNDLLDATIEMNGATLRNGEAGSVMCNNSFASHRVPCSKGDVFRSKLLSPVDKRRLMKFMQLISDYGTTVAGGEAAPQSVDLMPSIAHPTDSLAESHASSPSEGEAGESIPPLTNHSSSARMEDVLYSLNERHLNRGRALSRPQNKAKPSLSEMDALMRCVRNDISFSLFLTEEMKLPPRLSSVITHALALAPFGCSEGIANALSSSYWHYSTKDGLDDVLRHVSALGRFGDTAFLIPMYGSGELSQAFCRSGAVYGSTYMLRRSPLSISLQINEHEPRDVRIRGVILSGEDLIGGVGENTDDTCENEILCKHVIVPSTMLPTKMIVNTIRIRIHRRISLLQGKLMIPKDNTEQSNVEQRYLVVIPPATHGLNNQTTIYGVAVDDSVFVAPGGKGFTLLHLTASTIEKSISSDDTWHNILYKATQFLIANHSIAEDISSCGMPTTECHHISFSYSSDVPTVDKEFESTSNVSGLHICYRDLQPLTCDSAFREAKRVFESICPGYDFLGLAKQVEDAIVYRSVEDSDDDSRILSSAVGIIQNPLEVKETTHNEVTTTEA